MREATAKWILRAAIAVIAESLTEILGDCDRVADDLGRRPLGADFAIFDEIAARRDLQCFMHIMIGQQQADAFVAEFQDNLANLGNRDRIDAGERFVKKDEQRLAHQAARDLQPPLFAAGKPNRNGLAHLVQAEALNGSFHALVALFARERTT